MNISEKINQSVSQWLENIRDKWQIAEIQKNPKNFLYMENTSDKVHLALIEKNVDYIRAIVNPSEKVQLAAVKADAEYIRYLNPSEEVKLAAVQQDPYTIQYINNPSKAVIQLAVKHDPDSILEFISKLKPDMISKECLIDILNTTSPTATYYPGRELEANFHHLPESLFPIVESYQKFDQQMIDYVKVIRGIEPISPETINNSVEYYSSLQTYKEFDPYFVDIVDGEEIRGRYFFPYQDMKNPLEKVQLADSQAATSLSSHNLTDNSIIGKEDSEAIPVKEQTQLLGNKLSEEYRKLGYESIASAIDCSIKDFATNSGVTTEAHNQYQILKSGSKVLYGDITIENKNGIPEVNLSNLSIKDNSTGKTSLLTTNKMDLKELSANDMKKVLSGGKAQANASFFQLSKTAIGWSLTAAKQIFSTVDASAGI